MIPFLLFVIAATMAAVSLVVIPLFYRRANRHASQEDLTVLSDSMRELDAELEDHRISPQEYDHMRAGLLHDALKAEQARRADKRSRPKRTGWLAPLLVGMALPITAIGLYVMNGQPALVARSAPADANQQAASSTQIQQTIDTLREKLQDDEGNGERWLLLARSYEAAGQSSEGLSAYARAVALMPDNADLLVEYANALGRFNDRNLSGKPSELVAAALELDPENRNALALAGAAAMQQGDNEGAARHWARLERLIPEDSPDRQRVAALIARAEGRPVADTEPAPTQAVAASTARDVSGTIEVDESVADKISPSDTLFVFARVPDGPPMPVAAVRKPAAGWPVSFTLDDSTAMIEGMTLSSFERIDIVARVSQDGNADPKEGDIEGHAAGVDLGERQVRVVLDHVISGQ
ncbi:MAG TPA: c-type cytochrome biogenesis protein CcmI [Burkholderiaceae bacterium]|nr:c-type cytochrome biogenesis protein CcmI [Burkholderiaceae bacterium]